MRASLANLIRKDFEMIHSDKTLKENLEYLYHFSAMPPNIISKKVADRLNEINEQLEDLGIIDDEGCFKDTVLGNRAHEFAQEYI